MSLCSDMEQLDVYYDGTCPLCIALTKKIGASPQRDAFALHPIQDALPPTIDRAAAERDVHVVDRQGRIHRGADAIAVILAHSPRWRWLATCMRMPGIRMMAQWGYRIVADNRSRIFGRR